MRWHRWHVVYAGGRDGRHFVLRNRYVHLILQHVIKGSELFGGVQPLEAVQHVDCRRRAQAHPLQPLLVSHDRVVPPLGSREELLPAPLLDLVAALVRLQPLLNLIRLKRLRHVMLHLRDELLLYLSRLYDLRRAAKGPPQHVLLVLLGLDVPSLELVHDDVLEAAARVLVFVVVVQVHHRILDVPLEQLPLVHQDGGRGAPERLLVVQEEVVFEVPKRHNLLLLLLR
mmetsp:Transcript_14384/g.54263  ORF Transcript_14384/g.54263 Transcript_14384/m.54263 type:complete len:228 (+) Transcript_14384:1053-1736(+)